MSEIKNTKAENDYWSQRYVNGQTGWDIGFPSTPIKEYADQLTDKTINILIPGAGNAYEAGYLFEQGFENVHILDISAFPLQKFKERYPDFPNEQLIEGNFFEHKGAYDLIFEQTFFCSFPPTTDNRNAYAVQMSSLLKPGGKLVGLWFTMPLTGSMEKRPFGGDKEEYLGYFEPHFEVNSFEPCHNSITPRQGNELFGIFTKK